MGRFVNPDNSGFQTALNAEIYVDKTEIIGYTNRVLESTDAFICNRSSILISCVICLRESFRQNI